MMLNYMYPSRKEKNCMAANQFLQVHFPLQLAQWNLYNLLHPVQGQDQSKFLSYSSFHQNMFLNNPSSFPIRPNSHQLNIKWQFNSILWFAKRKFLQFINILRFEWFKLTWARDSLITRFSIICSNSDSCSISYLIYGLTISTSTCRGGTVSLSNSNGIFFTSLTTRAPCPPFFIASVNFSEFQFWKLWFVYLSLIYSKT